MSEDERYECIICCSDEGQLYRVCSCKTYIHEECFRQMVSEVASHGCQCPVCQKAYDFQVTTVENTRLRFVFCCVLVTVVACTIAPMIPNAVMCREVTFFCTLFHAILSITSGMSFCVCVYFCFAFRAWAGRWCPLITFSDTRLDLKLPQPANLRV